MLCGDPYSVENVLGPLLSHQQCYLSGDRSLTLETQFCDSKRKVEVILSSYHSAMDFRDELIHGFILVYSVKRRASLSTLTAFSLNIPELPIQLLAVSDDDFVNSDITSQLITEGNTLADRLNAHFMTSSTSIQQKCKYYTTKWYLIRKNEMIQFHGFFINCSIILHTFFQRSLWEKIRNRTGIFHGRRRQVGWFWRRNSGTTHDERIGGSWSTYATSKDGFLP